MRGDSDDMAHRRTRAIISGIALQPDVMDKLILWRMNDPRYAERDCAANDYLRSLSTSLREQAKKRSRHVMQKQLTLELRIDLQDADRVELIRKHGMELAKEWSEYAKMVAAGDPLKQAPDYAYYSDDFFAGHEEIDAMENVLAKAKKDFAHIVGDKEVNEDMVDALRELNEEQKRA